MSAFSFRRDFKKVQWGRTLWLNLLRALAAGVVWAIVGVVVALSNPQEQSPWYAFLVLPLGTPLAYLVMLPVYFLVVKIMYAISAISGVEGLGEFGAGAMAIVFGLALAVGDPLVFALHRAKPGLVPTEKFSFLNFALVLYVLDPAKVGLDH